ncbi:MAG: hypothetical protein QM831_22410 [Kofleriaceae bacterium]
MVVALGVVPAIARADSPVGAESFNGGKSIGISLGPTLGGAFSGTSSFTLGGELSLYQLFNSHDAGSGTGRDLGDIGIYWIGMYGDVMRDFSVDTTRVSFGFEVGRFPFGLDGGLVRGFSADSSNEPRTGFVVRPVLTLGYASLYFRVGHYFDDRDNSTFYEPGLSFKLPIALL